MVLYFYPKDNTPGCTTQACGFRDILVAIQKTGTILYGVSPDNLASHSKFIQKFTLPFPLLSDEGAQVATAYGIWKEKSMYGKKYMGIERTTFFIDENGKIAKIWRKVKPEGHAGEVLDYINSR